MENRNLKEPNILIVSNCTWYLYNFRADLLKKLKNEGYNLILLSPFDKYYNLISKYFIKSENLFLNRGSENPILELITILNILLVYLKYKPKLVHHFTIKPCIYGGLISRLLGIKNIINHITGLGPSFFSSRLKINFLNYLFQPIYQYAFNNKNNNLINIFHNDSDRYAFINKGITTIDSTLTIKGSGVNINHFKNDNLKNFNQNIQLLFPARIIKEKGIIELISACKELWDENYKFTLNIAGEIDQQNKSHLKKKDFEFILQNPNIVFFGKSNNMLSVYKKTDIVILPSWREGLSKSLLEAASMSLPIITTDAPGCVDLIEDKHSGFIVPVRNKDKLKSAIKKYIENPKLAIKFGGNARKKIAKEYTLQKINNKILKIYFEFLK